MDWMLWLAGATLLFWLAAGWEVMRGNRQLRRLVALDPRLPGTAADSGGLCWPRVTLVFAARNEGRTIGAAVPTMLQLDYPDLELIAIDDRSDDDTGAVLDKIAARDPRLRVDHLSVLPPGWMGKNHALHHGAARATGEWILFTDADIHFQPGALRLAVAYAESRQLDLLAAVPQLHEHGHFLGICVNAFSFSFTLGIRPWRISDPRSAAHGGVGAFNLVRAAKYRELGGHEPIRLRPDDDIKLGKLFKTRCARCDFLLGAGAISVSWYDSVGAMIRGLEKNAFASTDYRVWVPPFGLAAQAVLFFWPVVALVVATGPAWWLNAGAVAIFLWLGCDQTKFTGGVRWHGLLLPLGAAVFGGILLRSMFVTLRQGGIVWRGTRYPLAELKANRL